MAQTASNGVASFSDLSLNRPGTGYTLTATATSYGTVTSTAFNIAVGSPSALVFTTEPTTVVAGASLSSVVVTLQDVDGNTIPDSSTVVTLALNAGASGGTISGKLSQKATGGVATFTGLSVNKTGTQTR